MDGPWYFDSSLSSFRNFTRTSVGSSEVGTSLDAAFSCGWLSDASRIPSLPDSGGICLFCSAGNGVPTRLGASSSPITNSGSNSAGSGPLPGVSPSLLPLAPVRVDRVAGDSSRGVARLAFEADLVGDACDKRWRACSSAILESIAPFRRCN